MLGVPGPEATQWDESEAVGDCADKVCAQMEREAAQGALIFQDDTAVRIGSLRKENRERVAQAHAQGRSTPRERTGLPTTALAVKGGEHTAIFYSSSRRHAGENLPGRLDKRAAGRAKPLAMSEALLSHAVAAASRLMRCPCLAHGRRQCSDLEDVLPHACPVVLEVLRQGCDHDEQARQDQRSPAARLAYHQAQSQPLLDALQQWLDQQRDARLVAPNSALGKAIGSRRTPGQTLTRCLSGNGAPLDNHRAERVLQRCIRQRKNSLFSKRPHRAYIASGLTSLIATCLYGGVNAVESLVALQENCPEVFAAPGAWLPWTYQESRAPPQGSLRQS